MAVTSPASLSKIRNEFGTGAANLKSFNRGGGYVANHDNNGAISSSSSSLRISQYLNTDKDFDTEYGSNSGRWTSGTNSAYDGFSYSEIAAGYTSFGSLSSIGFTLMSDALGSTNDFTFVGVSQGSLTTSTIRGVFDAGTGSDAFPTTSDFVFQLDGNQTSFTWNSVIIDIDGGGGGTYSRSSAATPSGTYVGLNTLTYWIWYGSAAGFATFGTSNFRVQFVL